MGVAAAKRELALVGFLRLLGGVEELAEAAGAPRGAAVAHEGVLRHPRAAWLRAEVRAAIVAVPFLAAPAFVAAVAVAAADEVFVADRLQRAFVGLLGLGEDPVPPYLLGGGPVVASDVGGCLLELKVAVQAVLQVDAVAQSKVLVLLFWHVIAHVVYLLSQSATTEPGVWLNANRQKEKRKLKLKSGELAFKTELNYLI